MTRADEQAPPDQPDLAVLAEPLLDRLPILAEQLVGAIRTSDSEYRANTGIASDELVASCEDNLRQLVRKLVDPRTQTLPYLGRLTAIGRRRVEQGIPLASVLHAYRLGARMLWEALREEAAGKGEETAQLLIEAASRLWEHHDASSARIAEAYRQGELDLAQRVDRRRRRLVDGLLEGRGSETAFAHEAASALRIAPDGRYVVVVGVCTKGDEGGAARLAQAAGVLDGWGLRSTWRPDPSRCVGIVDVGGLPRSDGPSTVARALRRHAEGRVGISAVIDALADLPTARHLAERALASLPAGQDGVALLEERLPAALLAASPSITALLVRDRLGRLLDLPDHEQAPLLETLRVYVSTGGSATRSAGLLHCHRNTVLKRLRRIEELTGASFADATTMLSLALAVEAVGLGLHSGD